MLKSAVLHSLHKIKVTASRVIQKASIGSTQRRFQTSSHLGQGSGAASETHRTAAIVVIGDEILRGDVRDANAYFLLRNLRKFGVDVKRVAFVGDDASEIGGVVTDFAGKFNFVLTCGGIGPTHDDITYEAIARAFNQGTVLHQELWQLFKVYFDSSLTSDTGPLTRFATVPEKSRVIIRKVEHHSRTVQLALVQLDNIIILPGVPLITEKLFPIVVDELGLQEMPEISRDLFLALDEASLTQQLNEAVRHFKDIKFGSYPQLYGNYYKTRLRMEAGSVGQLEEATAFLRNSLPQNAIIEDYVENPLEAAHKRVELMATKYAFVREAYCVVWEALRRYEPSEICVAFSGGKDCTVIAYLYYAALQQYAKENQTNPKQNWLYVKAGSSRPEVDKFIEDSVAFYGAQLVTSHLSHKDALRQAVDSGMKLFLLGNRAVDPKGDTLDHFKETDKDWPSAMRAFPILNWDYAEVWTFLRELYVPYCPLYDQGFSSLGLKSTPNPKLAYIDERGVTRFRAAYLLDDKSTERIGRA